MRGVEEAILSWGVISMAVITIGNVLSRKFFNHSWSFSEEVSQFILVIITFMGVSYAARKGRHIRMTALCEMMPQKVQKAMILIVAFLTMIILFYLCYHSALYVMKIKAYGRVTPALRIPFYLVLIWVPMGLFAGAIQYGLAFVKNLREKEIWLSFEEKSEYREFDAPPDTLDLSCKNSPADTKTLLPGQTQVNPGESCSDGDPTISREVS
jgi:TRAP-type C4-dicarboxylate transport system permease small subunit